MFPLFVFSVLKLESYFKAVIQFLKERCAVLVEEQPVRWFKFEDHGRLLVLIPEQKLVEVYVFVQNLPLHRSPYAVITLLFCVARINPHQLEVHFQKICRTLVVNLLAGQMEIIDSHFKRGLSFLQLGNNRSDHCAVYEPVGLLLAAEQEFSVVSEILPYFQLVR